MLSSYTSNNDNKRLENIRIKKSVRLETPVEIKLQLPCSNDIHEFISTSRKTIAQILDGKITNKKIVIIGPCSIHNIQEALEYAKFIQKMQLQYGKHLFIIMRSYFTKPRTRLGWKGLMYDPEIDGSSDIKKGIYLSRELLLTLAKMKIPCSMEYLDTISPQYFDDLLSWGAIGARTIESQIHRELASGISTAIGFKNSTNGDIKLAIDAIKSANRGHCFLGCSLDGFISNIETRGNPHCHLILRGGTNGPNYDRDSVELSKQILMDNDLVPNIVIDCSHGNSEKIFKRQLDVVSSIVEQWDSGEKSIIGVMIESNLQEGKQKIKPKSQLKWGLSITDSCLGLEDSEKALKSMFKCLQQIE